MGSKRKSSDENGDGDASPTRSGGSKRCCCDRRDRGYTLDEFMKKLNPRELQQVQKIFQKYDKNAPELSSRECKYRFQFKNEFPDILYTDTNFKAEIVLVDASNNVISSGPMATGNIEIVVLKGDIDVDENGEWSKEEFNNYVLEPRKGKGSLLIGNLPTRLSDGIGIISDAKFTDNSCWTKSKTFRLGVRGMAKQVQEGISTDLRVLDRHMKGKKADPCPSINDKVYRLKGISKDGPYHKKLVECNINIVGDFLCYCDKNGPKTLRNMIGMKEGNWKKTYGHALKSRERPDILLDHCLVNPPAPPDQNFCELNGSSSSQNSNVPVQHNGMSTSAQDLAAPIGLESGNSSQTILIFSEGVSSGTNRVDIPFEYMLKENERSYLPNNFDIGLPLLRGKWLILFFVTWLKKAARRAQKSKLSETSSPRPQKSKLCEASSPRQNDDESVFRNLSPILSLTPIEEFYEALIYQNF